MKKWLSSVVIVLVLGVSASEAQYQRPVTNPYSNPGATPFYNPYLGGSSYGPILGNPGMLRPGTGTGAGPGVVAPGGLAPDATGAQAVSAFGNAGTLDPLLNDSTGHRTRFNSYSRYFNNQGGGGTFGTTCRPRTIYAFARHTNAPIGTLLTGNWYFEASFPVTLLDANGAVLARAPARAKGTWMTADYVGFTATLVFAAPATSEGELLLQNDNPSGEAGKSRSSRGLRGPVLPMQPPSTLAQITKKRLVSTGRPGPTTASHQPSLPVIGWRSATYWSPVSAWQTRMALLRSAFSVP